MMSSLRNELFTGRNVFLKKLERQLRININVSRYHGRVALFGLNKIGKTEMVLEFVYYYQSRYNRIYWISGIIQELLLDEYEKIVKHANVKIISDLKLIIVAEQVLSWLK